VLRLKSSSSGRGSLPTRTLTFAAFDTEFGRELSDRHDLMRSEFVWAASVVMIVG
jgi:hypothetical protein